MIDYKKNYFKLFNGITDIIESLKRLQIEVEEEYINYTDKTEDDSNRILHFDLKCKKE